MAANGDAFLNRPAFLSATPNGAMGSSVARWGIVLAGGEGMRMRPLISHWLGGDRPKQYCTFVGSRSMFQHTVDRARSIVSEEHVVSIIGRGHRKFLAESAGKDLPGMVLEQPDNLGTAPGVFLPVAYVLADSPDATILLLPSDHFVHPEDRFCEHMVQVFELAEMYPDRIILVGAIPTRAETEYGWIDPADALTHKPMNVLRFREKPDAQEACALLRQGSLWNTMVMAVKAKTLWALGRQYLPETMHRFDAFRLVLCAIREGRLDPGYEASALASIYSDLTPADFSRDILQHVSERSMVLRMDGVEWCDWGCPQRVNETLANLGRRPLFASDCFENVLASATLANEGHI
jgi:mannose-1-phosphate guanylyltransferase